MNSTHEEDRECLMDQVLSATTLQEIASAWNALKEWIERYPEEEGMRDGFGQLSLMEDAARLQELQHLSQEGRAA